MNTTDLAAVTVGELAVRYPAAARTFYRLGIDYCCAGRRSLAAACLTAGADPEEVLAAIGAATPDGDPATWQSRPMPELIAHIVGRYHEPLRAAIPQLRHLGHRVAHVHAEREPRLVELASVIDGFIDGIESHMAREEQVLFPAILRGDRRFVPMPIAKMSAEHEEHGAVLARLRELTDRYEPPAHACASWRALYAQLAEIEHELMDHIHLENNVLFPRALGTSTQGA
jgi:regulator of cell morphogenesis and NO signaling